MRMTGLVETTKPSYYRHRLARALLVICTFVPALLILSCRGDQTSSPLSSAPDINNYLREPGKVTHVRYTSFTPPWPTRTEAWIDWENNRIRSWNIQWTDNPTNPSICTSIQDGDSWHPCLPSRFRLEAEDFARAYAIWPKIPLRASDTELSLLLGVQALFADDTDATDWTPLKIGSEATTTSESQGDTEVVVNSWEIASDFDTPCDEGQTGSASFDYTATEGGEPISEFIMVRCGAERFQYLGVLYHEIDFAERSQLPSDFFDADAARSSLLADQLSSAAAQLGTVFWLGERAGDWTLGGAEHDADRASVAYSRGEADDEEVVELTTRVGTGHSCEQPEPIANDAYGGSLCRVYMTDDEYRIVWTPPGYVLSLNKESYPPEISRDDMLALAGRIEEWDKHASGPLLTGDDVRNLVADSLELVCPSKRGAYVRRARSLRSASIGSRGSGSVCSDPSATTPYPTRNQSLYR